MKCTESRELRVLSMNQLNAKLSELYKELPPVNGHSKENTDNISLISSTKSNMNKP